MKPKYFIFLCLSVYVLSTQYSQATIRYVSKTGTSTPPYTSWQTAADSIQKCINICVDGDTIYVANGVYKENLVINTVISLIGSSMDSTVIDGTALRDTTIFTNASCYIENFNIYGKGAYLITWAVWSREYLSLKNCKISNTGLGIVILRRSSNVENIIMNNLINGYDAGCFSGDCINYVKGIIMNLNQGGTFGASGIHISIGGTYYIDNNILLYNNDFETAGNGISCGWPKKVYIRNNLISGFLHSMFFDIVNDTAFIINNVMLNTEDHGVNSSISSSGNRLFVKNVVLSNNNKGISQSGGGFIKSNYNLFWNNVTDVVGINYGDSDQVADPMFVKDTILTPDGNFDFHLQKYSPAIDKGNPDILDVDGSRSDIGLFGGPYGEIYTYQDLAPKPPANLSASVDSGLVKLKWNKNTEADFYQYRVYRDTVPDFVYDTTKIIAVLSDTIFYDDPPRKFISGNYYYKITALDNALHQSAASGEVHINITGIPEAPPIVVEHYRLLNNYPNPFNPSTTIPYRIKAPGYVKVMVYTILGEMVRVLVNKYQNAGYYEVMFSPDEIEKKRGEDGFPGMETWYHSNYVSGVYLYRIEVIGEGNIPVFTDMKKMLLVK